MSVGVWVMGRYSMLTRGARSLKVNPQLVAERKDIRGQSVESHKDIVSSHKGNETWLA